MADTPFYPQERYQCGPAALLTVLAHSGAEATMDDLVARVYVPGRQGSLQTEMIAAARAAGRIPYVLDPTLAAVSRELEAGRPVLVMQNLGVGWWPRWHYAVIFGVDPVQDVVHLRSGTDRDRVTPVPVFLRTWARSEFWGFVVLRAGELPADAEPQRFFAALAAIESTGGPATVLPSWEAARVRWPEAATPEFALGNAAYASRDYPAAERHFRRALVLDTDYVAARNNLAYVLAATDRRAEAVAELEQALDSSSLPAAWRSELEDSLAQIASGNAVAP